MHLQSRGLDDRFDIDWRVQGQIREMFMLPQLQGIPRVPSVPDAVGAPGWHIGNSNMNGLVENSLPAQVERVGRMR